MKTIAALVLGTTLIIGSTFLATGCERQGPAEQAGKKVDQAVESMKDVMHTPGPAEKAGQALDRAVTTQTK